MKLGVLFIVILFLFSCKTECESINFNNLPFDSKTYVNTLKYTCDNDTLIFDKILIKYDKPYQMGYNVCQSEYKLKLIESKNNFTITYLIERNYDPEQRFSLLLNNKRLFDSEILPNNKITKYFDFLIDEPREDSLDKIHKYKLRRVKLKKLHIIMFQTYDGKIWKLNRICKSINKKNIITDTIF